MVESKKELTKTIERRIGGHENGLLKIAYELAWYWLGDAWLCSPEAISMREGLDGQRTSSPLKWKIFDDASQGLVALQGDARVHHICILLPHDGKLLVLVRIFDLVLAGFCVSARACDYLLPRNNAIVMSTIDRQYHDIPLSKVRLARRETIDARATTNPRRALETEHPRRDDARSQARERSRIDRGAWQEPRFVTRG